MPSHDSSSRFHCDKMCHVSIVWVKKSLFQGHFIFHLSFLLDLQFFLFIFCMRIFRVKFFTFDYFFRFCLNRVSFAYF
jgi:hypothetical protein